ncbi:MAG: hypothetical protein ALAOOOJD_03548 [bacterium]|nr:hypothetical protein [bacterium]
MNLRADTVLQRRDDVAPIGVIFRVRGVYDHHVERNADRETTNLNVFFLHDVEEADLDARLQIRQFVDRKNAAIGARNDAEMNDALVGIMQALRRGFDWIDIADQIGDRHIRRRQLFAVALLAADPFNLDFVAIFAHFVHARFAHRAKGIVVDFAIFDNWNVLIQQARQHAQNAALRLAAQAEQDEIMPRQNGVAQLRNHRIFITDDAGKQRLAAADFANEIVAHFVFHGDDTVTRSAQFTDGAKTEEVFHCVIIGLVYFKFKDLLIFRNNTLLR